MTTFDDDFVERYKQPVSVIPTHVCTGAECPMCYGHGFVFLGQVNMEEQRPQAFIPPAPPERGSLLWYQQLINGWAEKEVEAAFVKWREYQAGDGDTVFFQLERSMRRTRTSLWHAWLHGYGRHADALDADTPLEVRKKRLADLLGYAYLGLALCEYIEHNSA